MNKDFIENTINKLFDTFPNLYSVNYYFDEYSNTHFVKIDSIEIFNCDNFAKFDGEISLLAYKLNLESSICFISNDIVIDKVLYKEVINPSLFEYCKLVNKSDNKKYQIDIKAVNNVFDSVMIEKYISKMTNVVFNSDDVIPYLLAA